MKITHELHRDIHHIMPDIYISSSCPTNFSALSQDLFGEIVFPEECDVLRPTLTLTIGYLSGSLTSLWRGLHILARIAGVSPHSRVSI